ncbi:helix-turn-helix domain-containing protein [Paraherbaspirillum soli]|uniref:Type II toxin-antitoxin system HigA family antitoxin n=1 Tax=Paraherbaspirillum soli TaxID=631222 RepID=A0ABW0M5Y7_9BURK
MDIKPIHTEAEYEDALRMASAFFDHQPEPGTPDGDRFELLAMVIEAYEAKRYPVASPDPIEAIKFRMEQAGLTPKDLEPMIGRLNRVYEILSYKRPLTLPMIRRLHHGLGIPAESLIAEPAQA